ncbi:putative glucan endo-13-beta-glucosidase btgC [Spathaspora sp. JA1]|nr:putative glucan endo-13-beta-glucosidase btgC [Spathaspora sp. JA1]
MSNKDLRRDSEREKSSNPDNSHGLHYPKRSITISEFHPFSSSSYTRNGGQEENNNSGQPKLTKVSPYKITRSKTINTFNEFRRSSELSPTAFTKPLTSGQLNQQESPQSSPSSPVINKSNSVNKFARNSIDDDNAETPISFGQNSFNIPAYYCVDQSALNGSLLSTGSIPIPPGVDTTSNTASATRNATVIFRKKNKSPYESDYNLSEISPIESSPLRPLRKTTTQLYNIPIKEEIVDEINLDESENSRAEATKTEPNFDSMENYTTISTVLQPLVYNNSPFNKSTFREDDQNMDGLNQSDSFSKQTSNNTNKSSQLNWDFRFPTFTNKGYFIIFIGLILVIIMLLAGFIPAIVILSKGTKTVIDNYFSNSKNLPHLSELSDKYLPHSATILPNVTRINSIQGLNNEVKSDSEVVNLMDVVSNFMFHGISYSPSNAMSPTCGYSKKDAMLDLAKLSTVTTRIRNYGLQCNQTEIILDAIEHMNLNMTLAMGVWIGSNNSVNKMQMDVMKKIIAKHPNPSKVIHSIYIGNEVLFRQDKSKNELIQYIRDAKDFLKLMRIDDIPVGTSEIGSLIDRELLQACDVIGANIHPFFGGVPVENAVDWTLEFLHYQIEPLNEKNIPVVITEVGWPSGGGKFKGSIASPANLQYFVNEFLCTFKKLGIDYYFFEAFDEPWKKIFWEGNRRWETQWGIFNEDRSNKFNLQRAPCP